MKALDSSLLGKIEKRLNLKSALVQDHRSFSKRNDGTTRVIGDDNSKILKVFVPNKTKEAKEIVKKITDSDILELNKRGWNNSTNVREKQKPDLKQNLFEVKKGLKGDYRVVKMKDEADESQHSKIGKKPQWNNSTSCDTDVERNKKLLENTKTSFYNAENRWKYIQQQVYVKTVEDEEERVEDIAKSKYNLKYYVSPIDLANEQAKIVRNLKRSEDKELKNVRAKAEFDFPKSSVELYDAVFFKNGLYPRIKKEISTFKKTRKEVNHVNFYEEDVNPTTTQDQIIRKELFYAKTSPDHLNLNVKSGITYSIPEYYHAGEYKLFTIGNSNKCILAWTCCISFDEKAKGCKLKVKLTKEEAKERSAKILEKNQRAIQEMKRNKSKTSIPRNHTSNNFYYLQKQYEYIHPGTYCQLPFEKNSLLAWSCCANYDQSSEGCQRTKKSNKNFI